MSTFKREQRKSEFYKEFGFYIRDFTKQSSTNQIMVLRALTTQIRKLKEQVHELEEYRNESNRLIQSLREELRGYKNE